jgi:hypothetical protein
MRKRWVVVVVGVVWETWIGRKGGFAAVTMAQPFDFQLGGQGVGERKEREKRGERVCERGGGGCRMGIGVTIFGKR